MTKHDDYVSGSGHYGTHFWCGLVFGAILGALGGWWLFDMGLKIVISAIVTALIMAYCTGRWGDRAWHWVLERLRWLV